MSKSKVFINVAALVVLISAVAYMFILNYQRQESLTGEVNYTIGEVTEYKIGPKSRMLVYDFEVDSNNFEGHFSIDENFRKRHGYDMKSFIGRKFLVKYSIEKPKFNEIYIDKPIPNSLLNCKDCNWPTPPF